MNIFKKTYKYGFTLVELLVVITIIAILASVSFKAASVMNERVAVARTSERLAAIAACLAEYYAEFGQYPPGSKVKYEDWDEGTKPDNWQALVTEARESNSEFAQNDDDGLLFYLRKVMPESKWNEFKDEIGLSIGDLGKNEFISGNVEFTNKVYSLHDGWGQDFQYKCDEPYTSYKLYSEGSTGSENDNIHAGQKY